MVKPANWISATGTSPATDSPTRRADDRRLRDRRVEHALRAEAVERRRRWRGTRRRSCRRPRRAARHVRRAPSRRASVSRIAASMVMLATTATPVSPSGASCGTGRVVGHVVGRAPSDDLGALRGGRASPAAMTWSSARRGIDLARERAVDDALEPRLDRAPRSRRDVRRPRGPSAAARSRNRSIGSRCRHVLQLVVGDVARGVVGVGVRAHAVGDEPRAASGPSPAAARRRAVRVASSTASTSLPSTRTPGMPAASPLAANVARRGLAVGGGGDRPAVVDAHDDQRRPLHAGEVDGLVEVALRRGAVADERAHDAGVAAQRQSPREPGGVGELGAEGDLDRAGSARRRGCARRRDGPASRRPAARCTRRRARRTR